MADTSEEAFRVLIELNRKMSPGEKLARTLQWSSALKGLSEGSVRKMYPQAGEREVFLRAAARRLGWDVVKRVYGWDPETGQAP